MAPCDPETEEHGSSPQNPFLLKKKLKRKLDDGQTLDQYDCKFGIRLDGQVSHSSVDL
jgi:hypothetical protein